MSPATASQIAEWLDEKGDWVSTRLICERWDVTRRQLRPQGGRAGLLEAFAVSRSNHGGGYIHMRHATLAEVRESYERRRTHAHSQFKGAKAMLRRWQAIQNQPRVYRQPDLLPDNRR